MSETTNTPVETDNCSTQSKLNFSNVEKTLKKRRIRSMSKRKKIIWLLIILLIIGAAGYGAYKKLAKSENGDFLTTAVSKGTLTDSIEATGTLEAIKESGLGFKNDGTITAINVEPGDQVKKGQVLATQDSTSLKTALQQTENTIDQDQISVETSSLTLESNRKTMERQQKLYESGALAQSDLDTAQDNYKKSQLDLANAQAKMAADQIKLEQAQSDLSEATLTAPFDGIIGAVNGQVGQINGISNSTTSTLVTVLSEDLQISALINEADISQIKVGQNVEFTTTSYSDKTFTGKVLRITPEAETVSNIQYYPVLISSNDPDNQLLAGMSVSANIIIKQTRDVLTVPMMAVTYAQSYIKSHPSEVSKTRSKTGSTPRVKKASSGRIPFGTGGTPSGNTLNGTSEQTMSRVLVLENNKPIIKAVVLGLNDGTNYQIISGLKLGDKIIVGSNQVDSTSNSTNSNSSSSSKNSSRTQRSGGAGMGGPPGGGF